MKYEIIYTENYALIVSDEEMNENEYYLYKIDKWYINNDHYLFPAEAKKIIAHRPLTDAPILEGVLLLPPLEDDVEQLAIEKYPVNMGEEWTEEGLAYPLDFNNGFRQGFIDGYNKAKETYKYTEDDVAKLIHLWDMHINQHEEDKGCIRLIYKHIQSLQQSKLPMYFESEVEVNCTGNNNNGCFLDSPGHNCGCVSIKTITNSQGQTELVGTYYYE